MYRASRIAHEIATDRCSAACCKFLHLLLSSRVRLPSELVLEGPTSVLRIGGHEAHKCESWWSTVGISRPQGLEIGGMLLDHFFFRRFMHRIHQRPGSQVAWTRARAPGCFREEGSRWLRPHRCVQDASMPGQENKYLPSSSIVFLPESASWFSARHDRSPLPRTFGLRL
jgi:hypothetical protein